MTRQLQDAMRSGEWLRTQWIARVAGLPVQHTRAYLKELVAVGRVERRDAEEVRRGEIRGVPVEYPIPRDEWRLVR